MAVTMDKVVSLAKRRGFIYPGSDIYGGLANTWDYGPLGARLLPNIKNLFRIVLLNEFYIFNTGKRWYPIGIIGITLNVPVFDGLQKNYRIQQSKLSLMKTVKVLDLYMLVT